MVKFLLVLLFTAFCSVNTFANTDKFTNFQCAADFGTNKKMIEPSVYLIRHLSDESATIIITAQGRPHDRAHLLINQSMQSSDARFSYSLDDMRKYKNNSSLKIFVSSFYLDRITGRLNLGSYAELVRPNGTTENISLSFSYLCIKITDQQFDDWHNSITLAKEQKAIKDNEAEQERKQKILREREF